MFNVDFQSSKLQLCGLVYYNSCKLFGIAVVVTIGRALTRSGSDLTADFFVVKKIAVSCRKKSGGSWNCRNFQVVGLLAGTSFIVQ